MRNKKVSDIFPIGQKVFFHSGNFIGNYGVVEKVDNDSKNPIAIYGFLITIKLENGSIVFAEKSEHLTRIIKM